MVPRGPFLAFTKGPFGLFSAFIWALLLLTLGYCCEIKDLEYNSLTSTSVVLTWNLGDCEGRKVERYKAYPKHRELPAGGLRGHGHLLRAGLDGELAGHPK